MTFPIVSKIAVKIIKQKSKKPDDAFPWETFADVEDVLRSFFLVQASAITFLVSTEVR